MLKKMPSAAPEQIVTVCDNCLRASCWQGIFYCDLAKTAGTVEKPVSELLELQREHPSWFIKEIA